MINIPKQVQIALTALENAGYEAYIVGGCVRDYLMNIEPHDIDITTSALPEEVKAVFAERKVIETGIKHGTVTVIIEGVHLEITTFRVEGEYLDGRRPSTVTFTRSLKEDAARRDFTMNAMAYDIRGNLYDFFGGKQDIEAGVIRCVGNPVERFNEDALRIMRALRFASTTGFKIEGDDFDNNKNEAVSIKFDNDVRFNEYDTNETQSREEGREHQNQMTTLCAARWCKGQLAKISAERIREELVKLLCGKDAKRVIMEYTDILEEVLPELAPMKNFDQKTHWHIYDVLEHTAVAVANVPPTPVLRLAMLFHDIGKPSCFTVDEKGKGHFYGHPKVSAEITRDIMNRLKFDNDTKYEVLRLVEKHDVHVEMTEKSVKRLLNKMGVEGMYDLIKIKRADNLAQNPEFAIRQQSFDELEALVRKVIDDESCFSMKDLAVDGSMLIEAGMKPGPELGEVLKKLLDAVIEGEIPNEKAKLLEFAGFSAKKD